MKIKLLKNEFCKKDYLQKYILQVQVFFGEKHF